MKKMCRICLSLALLFAVLYSKAQSSSDVVNSFRCASKGGIVGFGNSTNTDTRYQIYYLAGDFSWSFKKIPKKRDFVAWYFEPQFNLIHTPKPLDIEFGANLGIRNYIRVNNGLFFYQMLGSGPHFITADVGRQAKGFIFSDNLAFGSFIKVNRSLFLNLQYRQRHISNAGLKHPNGGINSYNFLIGLSRIR